MQANIYQKEMSIVILTGGKKETMCFLRQQTYHLMMKSTPERSNSLERDPSNNTASKQIKAHPLGALFPHSWKQNQTHWRNSVVRTPGTGQRESLEEKVLPRVGGHYQGETHPQCTVERQGRHSRASGSFWTTLRSRVL